jgi:mRNA (guanine-N7-)-methyltransferase
MDLGCGKGSDLNKFSKEGISGYVGIDVSAGQLVIALNRRMTKNFDFPTLFIKGKGQDQETEFNKFIPEGVKFNIISAQFCIHYFFESEYTVRNFLQNISNNLSKDGLFISTIPDSKVIAKKFYKDGKVDEVTGLSYIENKFFSIATTIKNFGELTSAFGNKYGFYMEEGLIGNKVKVKNVITKYHIPEYLIISDHLIELAREYDLEVEIDQNFHDFYASNLAEYKDFYDSRGYRRVNEERLMCDDLWECSYLYKVLMFRKVSGDKITKNNYELIGKGNYWEIRNINEELIK